MPSYNKHYRRPANSAPGEITVQAWGFHQISPAGKQPSNYLNYCFFRFIQLHIVLAHILI